MHRVVITGLGIVSSIGNNSAEVLDSLKAGKSGITSNADMIEHGFRSQIAGDIKLDVSDFVDKRTLRFMGPGAAYAHIAMEQAIKDAGLEEREISNYRTGLIRWLWRPFNVSHVSCPSSRYEIWCTKTNWTICCSKVYVFYNLCKPIYSI